MNRERERALSSNCTEILNSETINMDESGPNVVCSLLGPLVVYLSYEIVPFYSNSGCIRHGAVVFWLVKWKGINACHVSSFKYLDHI